MFHSISTVILIMLIRKYNNPHTKLDEVRPMMHNIQFDCPRYKIKQQGNLKSKAKELRLYKKLSVLFNIKKGIQKFPDSQDPKHTFYSRFIK